MRSSSTINSYGDYHYFIIMDIHRKMNTPYVIL